MSAAPAIAKQLEELPPASAIALNLKPDLYFDAIRATVDLFATKQDLIATYITSSIPSKALIEVLKILEVDLSRIYFVDCISHTLMGKRETYDNVLYVESPTMLEYIMLKVMYITKKNPGRKHVVVIDSINSLAIHNNVKMLSEFLHIFLNNMRTQEAYSLIYMMEESTESDIGKMISLVCDNIIEAQGGD